MGFRSGFMFHNLEWIKQLNVQYDASASTPIPSNLSPMARRPFSPSGSDCVTVMATWSCPTWLRLDAFCHAAGEEQWHLEREARMDPIRGGMALLNVHPDYVDFGQGIRAEDEFPVQHYAEFLTWLKENHSGQYWHALPVAWRISAANKPARRWLHLQPSKRIPQRYFKVFRSALVAGAVHRGHHPNVRFSWSGNSSWWIFACLIGSEHPKPNENHDLDFVSHSRSVPGFRRNLSRHQYE